MHIHAHGLEEQNDRAATRAIALSLAVAVVILVGKVAAAWITGSRALLSDALESVIHIAATGIAVFSVWYARQPATKTQPYGYERIVFFSSGMEGALISIAALSILGLGLHDIIVGPEVEQLGLGLLLTGTLALLNLALGLYLVRTGRRTRSIAVEANGHHTLTDVWTSAAVLVGVAIVWVTDIVILDPIVAMIAGLNILWTGGKLMGKSFRGLMGAADPEEADALRRALDAAREEGLIRDFHALRMRTEGRTRWAEVHLLMEGTLPLTEAHRRATAVEEQMRDAMGQDALRVTSHLEPAAHDQAHPEGHRDSGDLA